MVQKVAIYGEGVFCFGARWIEASQGGIAANIEEAPRGNLRMGSAKVVSDQTRQLGVGSKHRLSVAIVLSPPMLRRAHIWVFR